VKTDHDPFHDLRTPAPPPELARRALDAAGRELAREQRPGVWDRLWAIRPLRLAWTLATFGLLTAHAALSLPETKHESAPAGTVVEQATPPGDLLELFDLPQLTISPRAARMCLGPAEEPAPSTEDNS
jgi:hypothetical protein